MERSQAYTPSTTLKKGHPKSFLSRIFHTHSVPITEETDQEADKPKSYSRHLEIRDRHQHHMMNTSYSSPTSGSYMHTSTETVGAHYDNHDIEIPDRRQSHLYTPFHSNVLEDHYKRRSCYSAHLAPSDANISSSSLTRSATWQPSSSSNGQSLDADIIPDRRTSRNYAANPEIQARLNAMLNSDRTAYLSTVLQNNRGNSGNSNVQRRSTTPSNTMS